MHISGERKAESKLRAKGRRVIYPDLSHVRQRMKVRDRRARAKECAACREADLMV
jgi:hypothetical protein